jgi:lipopolysaccharide export system permease protein
MKILDSYIGRAVLGGTLVTMLVLLPLVGFLLLADELDNVGTGRYSLSDAFLIIGLALPGYAYQVLPIAALIGSLLGLGNLAAHSELIALRAAGISVGRIVWAVLKAGMVTALVVVALGEGIAPYTEEHANRMRAELLSEGIALKSRYGFWARDGNTFINIRQILPGGRLKYIHIYELDAAKRLKLSTYADSAFYTEDAWRLEGIYQAEVSEEGVRASHFSQAVWASLLDPGMLSLLVVDPYILPVWSLLRYIRFMEDNGLNATSYEVAFWGKLAAPVVVLAMIFLSVPMLFGALRTVGVGQRVFVGVLIGIAFFIVNKAFSQVAIVYPVSPLLAAFMPGILCLAAAVWVFRRVH